MRKALHDILKQLNQDLIVVDVGAPQGAQLNHDLIVYMRHMGKALHDAIEQLNQDFNFSGCWGLPRCRTRAINSGVNFL